ncbi:ribosomal large subunit pseudouridine synthase D [Oceanobacillus limi]|uniref:Pseudouridine synthase n=1 Tax=Oceanobacillus limi TaxID=930131 RepID=A0A1I0C8U2_9BACI|nr:RluA family pseudouridine synthase [Oceanobacillus limi]SET15812.1 ribosomal large subunit pseudouridine synthase D [Oceanobacillus limi]
MEWTISSEFDGVLIRDFLLREQEFSRRIVKAIIHDGGSIRVNGHTKTVRFPLRKGDRLRIDFPPETIGTNLHPEPLPLNIRYEDEAVIVLEKEAGMATMPSINHKTRTLANGIIAHYQKNNVPYTVHVVTRLDRDTSGLLLVAKHRYSHSILSTQQKAGLIKRRYVAVVEGKMHPKSGVIDAPIGRKAGSIIERTVVENGQRAVTHYSELQSNYSHSLLDIELETGRTHQIRVHFSHIGHPLAGDDLYGGCKDRIQRQALHCHRLTFLHPITKEKMTFSSSIPKDMRNIIKN